jgi:hypothetical protein
MTAAQEANHSFLRQDSSDDSTSSGAAIAIQRRNIPQPPPPVLAAMMNPCYHDPPPMDDICETYLQIFEACQPFYQLPQETPPEPQTLHISPRLEDGFPGANPQDGGATTEVAELLRDQT